MLKEVVWDQIEDSSALKDVFFHGADEFGPQEYQDHQLKNDKDQKDDLDYRLEVGCIVSECRLCDVNGLFNSLVKVKFLGRKECLKT